MAADSGLAANGPRAGGVVRAASAARRPARGADRTRRLLVGLSLLQTALVSFLFLWLSDSQSRSREIAQRLARIEGSAHALHAAPDPAGAGAQAATSEDDLRRILKDELAIALAQQNVAATAEGALARPAPARDPKQMELLRSEIDAEFTALAGLGRATPGRMAALQAQIAKLPPAERRAALSGLSRAISEGRIDANF